MVDISQVDQLLDRIEGNLWMGKEYFPISDAVLAFIEQGESAFLSAAPTQQLQQIAQLKGTESLAELIEKSASIPGYVQAQALRCISSIHSVNRAFNSQLYPTLGHLEAKLRKLIEKLLFQRREELLYAKELKTYNHTLGVPKLSEILAQASDNSPSLLGINPVSSLSAVSHPNVNTIVDTLLELMRFLLRLTAIPPRLLEPAALVSSSIITKAAASSGELIAKYSLAKLLKSGTVPLLVPTVEATVSTTAWTTLMPLAPYMIVAAIIIGVALSESQKKLAKGSDFYLFQILNGQPAGWAHTYYRTCPEERHLAAVNYIKAYFRQIGRLQGDIKIVVLDAEEPVLIYNADGVKIAQNDEARKIWDALDELFFPQHWMDAWQSIEWEDDSEG
jgi:hypothetical protein